jgi:hypothetical protein
MTDCDLHQPMKNMSFKVAIGTALPCLPDALHHGNPIPAGYARVTMDDIVLGFARVMVDGIVSGFEDLEIDIPTPEGDVKIGDVKRYVILWPNKYIKFPALAPRPPTPRNPSPSSPDDRHPPTSTLPLVHLRHRVSRHRP